jgi:hypothetical protein
MEAVIVRSLRFLIKPLLISCVATVVLPKGFYQNRDLAAAVAFFRGKRWVLCIHFYKQIGKDTFFYPKPVKKKLAFNVYVY